MAISQSGRPASEIIAPCTRGNRVVIDNVLVVIEPGDPLGSEALQLLQQMQAEALKRYADAISDSPPPSNELLVPRSAFLLTRLNVQAVGCAALRPLTVEIAEVKRMYVAQSVRRRGIGRLLVAALEQIACAFGYRALRLETGIRQPEAIALYKSQAFHHIARYGEHLNDPLSICFEKNLPL